MSAQHQIEVTDAITGAVTVKGFTNAADARREALFIRRNTYDSARYLGERASFSPLRPH